MIRRARSNIQHLDYKLYNKTGRKVIKGKNSLIIMENKIDNELKLVCKISRFVKEFAIELLYDIEDIEAGIKECRELTENYEGIHIVLKRELAEEYEEAYQEYDTITTSLVNWLRNARMEIRKKKEGSEMVRTLAEEEKLRKIRDKLKAEEKYLRERIELEKESIGAHKSWFLEDVEKNINVLRELSLEDSGIFIRIEEIGEDYLEGFGSIYQKTSHEINNFIKDLNQKA